MPINRGKQIGPLAGLGIGATLLMRDSGARKRERTRERLERKPRSNHQLAARVAAELDHHVAHGKGIQVFAADDRITLRGVAMRNELADVMAAIHSVEGIRGVRNNLELCDSPGRVLALQS